MAEEVATDVNAPVQDTGTQVSSPEETKLEVVTEGKDLNPNDYQDEPETEVEDSKEEATDETKDEKPQDTDKPLSPKAQNRFQQLANERNEALAEAERVKRELEELQSRKTQVVTEQDLLNETNPETGQLYTPAEAERAARAVALDSQKSRLEEQVSEQEIRQNQLTLANEALQITTEMPIFRQFNTDGSPNGDYVPELAEQYNELLSENLLYKYTDGETYTAKTLAENGINPETQATLVGSTVSPYKLAKLAAAAYSASALPNQIKGQKATEKMLAAADNVTNAKPAKLSKADEANMTPAEYAKAHNLDVQW